MLINEKTLSKDELLKLIPQERIMFYYFNTSINTRDKYKNPWRDDKNASCFFRYSDGGVLNFYDYASDKQVMNCFDIATLATGVPFPKVILRIKEDLRGEIEYSIKEKIAVEEKKETDLRVSLIPFEESDYIYWGKCLKKPQYAPKILKYFNIRKCKRVWINGKLWAIDKPRDPIYRYRQKDRLKTYRPFAKKSDKFRNNYYGGLLDGWEQLPVKGDVCFIQKAMKEVVSMYSYGYSSVGVRGEGMLISANALDLLRLRFKYIIPYMDNDEAGKKALKRYEEEYGLKGICNPDGKPKDWGDWVEVNKEEPELWIEQQITNIKNT